MSKCDLAALLPEHAVTEFSGDVQVADVTDVFLQHVEQRPDHGWSLLVLSEGATRRGELFRRCDRDEFLDEHVEGEEIVLSAGGGIFFDLVVAVLADWRSTHRTAKLRIRPGSYITHDSGHYERITAFTQPGSPYSLRPALELWGRVLSTPEPGLAFLDFGRRDAPFDQGLPMPHTVREPDGSAPRALRGAELTGLNDQHAYLSIAEDEVLQPGQWVGCGVSHPCTSFDKWHYLPVVDTDYRCVDAVNTVFCGAPRHNRRGAPHSATTCSPRNAGRIRRSPDARPAGA